MRCASCQAEHPPNTIFCDECGASFVRRPAPARGAGTAPLSLPAALGLAPSPGPGGGGPGQALRIRLTAVDGVRRIEMPLERELYVGRCDPQQPLVGPAPDIDLEPWGGGERGVSRRHARFVRRGGEIWLEDLGSLNGTRVGSALLAARQAQALRPGDEIHFGKIILKINWESMDF